MEGVVAMLLSKCWAILVEIHSATIVPGFEEIHGAAQSGTVQSGC